MERGAPEQEAAAGLLYKIRPGDSAESPVAFLVHGRAGTFDVMSPFRRVIPAQWTIIAPQAPLADPIGGYSWWQVSEHGAVSDRAVEAAEGLARFSGAVLAQHVLTPRSVIALGFSQGAGTLSLWMRITTLPLAGVALLAGFAVHSERTPLVTPKPKLFVAHGSKDEVIPLSRARAGLDSLRAEGFEVTSVEEDVGHKVGSAGMTALKEWIERLSSRYGV